jgi:transposase
MNISENTFVNWKKAWLSEGLNGLIRKEGQGRKQIISLDNPQHLEVIEEALKDESINLKALQKKLLQELDISVSIDTVKRLIKNRLGK